METGKTVVVFCIDKHADDNMFDIVKKVYKINGYCVYHSNEPIERKVLMEKITCHDKAKYFCAVYNYFWQNHRIEIDDNELEKRKIDVDSLAYKYVNDSLGSNWSLQNGYKLMQDFFIDLWLNGASFRFGILEPVSFDISKIRNKLKESVGRVLSAYCHC